MAQSSWPSPDNGRVVNDSQYERLALSYGPVAGLIGSPADTDLIYGDSTGLQVKVRADRYAVVRGYEWWSGAVTLTQAIASNSSGQTRTDLIVLRLSRTTWNVTIAVIAGTPGAGAPAATQNTGSTGVWELPLATVTVANGAATITAGNVTHLGLYLSSDGSGYVVPNTAALAYIPGKFDGMMATVARVQYFYDGSAWSGAVWAAYGSDTTSLTATTSNPTKGSGSTFQFDYIRESARKVSLRFAITIGTGFAAGSGGYRFLLPVAASAGAISSGGCGIARVVDAGTNIYLGVLLLTDATHCGINMHGNAFELGSGGPGTPWATGDSLNGSLSYEPV